MLSLDDPKWKTLKGGYKVTYDPTPALLRLERGEDVWDELWQELHHQGDVGEASYAAVPHLVRICRAAPIRDWNLYGLLSTIEIERHRKTNPAIPDWLAQEYQQAWQDLIALALEDLKKSNDPITVRSILGATAIGRGDLKLGALISHLDDSEIEEFVEEYYAWSELYSQPTPANASEPRR